MQDEKYYIIVLYIFIVWKNIHAWIRTNNSNKEIVLEYILTIQLLVN